MKAEKNSVAEEAERIVQQAAKIILGQSRTTKYDADMIHRMMILVILMLEMSTIKITRLIVHRSNTCKGPLVSSPFLVSCGFCRAQLWQPSCSVLFCLK